MQNQLGVKNISDLTIKAMKSNINTNSLTKKLLRTYKRQGKEFVDDLKGMYIHQDLALSIIIYYRPPAAVKFKTKSVYIQHDLIMT